MNAPQSPGCIPDRLRRLMSAAGAALVLVLAFSTVSPSLHALFHAADNAPTAETDDCAVMQFAGSAACPVACFTLAPAATILEPTPRLAGSELFLVSPRYLRQPERGPPMGWLS